MAAPHPDGSWIHREAIINGIRIHYVEAGEGPLVVLLHGFPEFWYAWRRQIPALAQAGFHVVAPDMRGYNISEKPIGIDRYRMEELTADVAALIRHVGAPYAAIVGHDWGGVVAWQMPLHHPELVDRLAVLNAPHPGALLRELRTLQQFRKSWYVFFFQLPWLPEFALRSGDYAALRAIFGRQPASPDAYTPDDIERYIQAAAQPGALSAALNYYRALGRRSPRQIARQPGQIDVPTLLIWGEQDITLGLPLTENLHGWVPNLRVERIPEASHWVQADVPERVNALLVDFLHRG